MEERGNKLHLSLLLVLLLRLEVKICVATGKSLVGVFFRPGLGVSCSIMSEVNNWLLAVIV